MKRIISFVLCLGLVVSFSACGEGTISKAEKTIAVEYGSDSENACDEYASVNYTKNTYNSSSDVIIAVENKKSDYGILDEFELNSYLKAGRNIKQSQICEYSIDYCAYFNSDNEQLHKSFNEALKKLKENGELEKIKNSQLKGERFFLSETDNENGTLTMLCDPSFENRVYTDNNGNIAGLDVDIAREICNYLGFGLEIVTADFDELFMKLSDGEADFIMSACEVNEERAEYYLLSDTYFTLNFYLIERI